MSVTVRDVAKAAGVSASTVSRVLTSKAPVSAATKDKVMDAVRKLGYVPPQAGAETFEAGEGAHNAPRRIGVVLPPFRSKLQENSFFLEVLRGISNFCNMKSCSIALINGSSADELLAAVRSLIASRRPDGFILLYSHKGDPVTEEIISEDIPMILVGKGSTQTTDLNFIDNDNIAAAREATAYLAKLGHTKIGYITNHSEEQFSADRKAGYLLALAENGLDIHPEWIVESDGTQERTDELLDGLFALPELPTALVAADDLLAVLSSRHAWLAGLKLPQDLSIVSFNDSLLSRVNLPALTSVDIQAKRLGREAAAQLLARLDNPDLPPTKVIVPHELVVRDSCIPARGAAPSTV